MHTRQKSPKGSYHLPDIAKLLLLPRQHFFNNLSPQAEMGEETIFVFVGFVIYVHGGSKVRGKQCFVFMI